MAYLGITGKSSHHTVKELSLSLFIARRIYRESDGGKQVSRPAVLIAMADYIKH